MNTLDADDPYEPDEYGTYACRGYTRLGFTYGGWMDVLRIALVYGWIPEGGSYYGCINVRRTVSAQDASNIAQALKLYLEKPDKALRLWVSLCNRPQADRPRIFPMGDEISEPSDEGYKTRSVRPEESPDWELWERISKGGWYIGLAERLARFCDEGEFQIN